MGELESIKEKVQGLNVLFVDDEESIRKSTGRFLKKFFNAVEVAVDGVDGIEKFKNSNFDVVITDILMPKMDGEEMAKEIVKLKPKTLVVFVTASRDHDLHDGVENSFKVTKPLSFELISEVMREIAKRVG